MNQLPDYFVIPMNMLFRNNEYMLHQLNFRGIKLEDVLETCLNVKEVVQNTERSSDLICGIEELLANEVFEGRDPTDTFVKERYWFTLDIFILLELVLEKVILNFDSSFIRLHLYKLLDGKIILRASYV